MWYKTESPLPTKRSCGGSEVARGATSASPKKVFGRRPGDTGDPWDESQAAEECRFAECQDINCKKNTLGVSLCCSGNNETEINNR